MAKKAIILTVFGKVQGVGFRYYTHKKALELKISGFVKNMNDGSVYIEAEGEPGQLEEFANWCEIGPSWARVVKIDRQDVPPTNPSGFNVR
jgi:acylphosphatase